MDEQALVRPYQLADRAAVRRICCDTADIGQPMEKFFHDREVFADLWTRYYTDDEPEHLWVAELNGQVVGYITAAWDGRRLQSKFLRMLPWIVFKALIRGTLFRPSTLRLLRSNRRLLTNRQPEPSYSHYPVEFHMNLDAQARGQGIGLQLLNAFCAQVRNGGLRGVRAAIRADNTRAIAFFKRRGFARLANGPTFIVPGQASPQKVVYGLML